MRIVCDKCDAKYVFPDEKIVRKTVRLTCRKCGNVITARVDDEVSESATLGKWRQSATSMQRRTTSETPGWYYSHNGESFGPYTQAELEAKVASPSLQSIADQCYVWHKTLETWRPLVEIEPFASAAVKPPPAPPAPKKAPVSTGLPPLYSGKVSTGRSTSSNPRVSPNISALKQRLMSVQPNGENESQSVDEERLNSTAPTVTHESPLVAGEAPTHEAMPMVEEIMAKAMKEVPDEALEGEKKVQPVTQSAAKGVPLVSFQSLDAISGAGCLSEGGKKEVLSKPFPTLSSIRPIGKKDALGDRKEVGGANVAQKPLLSGLGTKKTASETKSVASANGLPRLGGLGKPAIGGISPLSSLKSKPVSGSSVSGDNKGVGLFQQSQKNGTEVKTSEVPLVSPDKDDKGAASEKPSVQTLLPLADEKKAHNKNDALGDWLSSQNPFGMDLKGDAFSLSGLTGQPETGSKDLISGLDFSALDKAAMPFSETINDADRKSEQEDLETPIDLDVNTSAEEMAAIDLEASPAVEPLDSIDLDALDFDAEPDVDDKRAPSLNLAVAVDLDEGFDDEQAVAGEPNLVGAVDLDEGFDEEQPDDGLKSDLVGAIELDENIADEQAVAGEPDLLGAVDLDESFTDEPAAPEVGAIDLDKSPSVQDMNGAALTDAQANEVPVDMEEAQDLGGFAIDLDDEASCLLSEDLVNDLVDNARMEDEAKRDSSAARVRVNRLEELQKRQAELAAASAVIDNMDQPEDNPDGPSEKSMLIDFAHLAQLEKESKNKRNVKFIAIVAALVGIVLILAVAGGIKYMDEQEDDGAAVVVGTASGRMIDSDDVHKQVEELNDIEIVGDKQVQRPRSRSGEKAQGEKTQRDSQDADLQADSPDSVDASDELGIIALPSKRADGRQAAILGKTAEFGSTDNVTGSKYSGTVGKSATGEGPDRIEAGWRKLTPSVNACQKRLAKTGSLKVDAFYLNLQVSDSGSIKNFSVSPEDGTEELVKCLESKKDTWDFGEGDEIAIRRKFVN